MYTKTKLLALLLIVATFLTLISCSEEIYENNTHKQNHTNKNEISFKQFKNETGIKDFQTLKSVNFGFQNSRVIETEFLIDTLTIKKYISLNNKDTYTFKIYPITQDLAPKEYYNLVYEKIGSQWNELIFKNTDKENPQIGEAKLQSSEMIYNKLVENLNQTNSMTFCEVITISVDCDGSCNGECDGFACPTGQCLTVSVSYVLCDDGGSGSSGNNGDGNVAPPDNGGGGNDYGGIFIPNPYDGQEDLNNPSFIFATQVAAFTRTLPINLKNLIRDNYLLYPTIVDFMRNNGGLTQENKDSVVFALSNFSQLTTMNLPNFTFTEINQFMYNAFKYLLENPTPESQNLMIQIKVSSLNGTLISLMPFFKYPIGTNYATLYPEFTYLVKDYVPTLKADEPLISLIVQLTGLTNEDVKKDLTWGDGPEINVVQLGLDQNGHQYKGKFNPLQPDKIFVDIDLVMQLENNPNGETSGMLRRFITYSVLLHELVHYADFDADQIMTTGELGLYFEELLGNGWILEFVLDANGNETGEIAWIKIN